MTTLRILCPWPPASISPNAKRRSHWSSYSGDTKAHRTACFWLTREAAPRGFRAPDGPSRVVIEFQPPDARHRDDDNMTGSMKAARDGIAAALGHDDRTWRGKVSYLFGPPMPPLGQVVVTLEFGA